MPGMDGPDLGTPKRAGKERPGCAGRLCIQATPKTSFGDAAVAILRGNFGVSLKPLFSGQEKL